MYAAFGIRLSLIGLYLRSVCVVGYVDAFRGEKQSWPATDVANKLLDQDCLIEQYKLALRDRDNELESTKRVSTVFFLRYPELTVFFISFVVI